MENIEIDPLKRFSNRVDNYIKYRPYYPDGIMDFFLTELKLKKSDIIADIGSRTGIFTEFLLKKNYKVFAIEPNNDMRGAAERLLSCYNNFKSISGSAESTGLEAGSIDIITSAQAFHWFNFEKTKFEFKRIIKNGGWVVLIWNTREINSNPFMIEYEKLLINFSIDYGRINHSNINESIFQSFFSKYEVAVFPNKQSFNFEGLKGRLLSSWYAPVEDSPGYIPMMNNLTNIFWKYQINGKVDFIYKTEVYYGIL